MRVDLIGGALVAAIAAGQAVVVDSPAGDGAVPAGDAVEATVEGEEAGGAAVPGLEVDAHCALVGVLIFMDEIVCVSVDDLLVCSMMVEI